MSDLIAQAPLCKIPATFRDIFQVTDISLSGMSAQTPFGTEYSGRIGMKSPLMPEIISLAVADTFSCPGNRQVNAAEVKADKPHEADGQYWSDFLILLAAGKVLRSHIVRCPVPNAPDYHQVKAFVSTAIPYQIPHDFLVATANAECLLNGGWTAINFPRALGGIVAEARGLGMSNGHPAPDYAHMPGL